MRSTIARRLMLTMSTVLLMWLLVEGFQTLSPKTFEKNFSFNYVDSATIRLHDGLSRLYLNNRVASQVEPAASPTFLAPPRALSIEENSETTSRSLEAPIEASTPESALTSDQQRLRFLINQAKNLKQELESASGDETYIAVLRNSLSETTQELKRIFGKIYLEVEPSAEPGDQPPTAVPISPLTNTPLDLSSSLESGIPMPPEVLEPLEADQGNKVSFRQWMLFFITMLMGIAFKSIWDSSSPRELFTLGTLKPILIAPLVFSALYATLETMANVDVVLTALIAFQNGFFWQSILQREETKFSQASL